MKYLFILLLCFNSHAWSHLKSLKTKANNHAFAKNLDSIEESIWPYEVQSIGHSMQSYQNYSFSPYWHDGLDIRGNAGQKVLASVSGKIVNIENYHPGNDLYWEIAILDDSGFVWKYHHVDKNSIPNKIYELYKSGKRINIGDHIGNIVYWPNTSFGEKYHHIHLLIVDGLKRYVNPFLLLPKLEDDSSPIIDEIGLFNRRRKRVKSNLISGKHGIYVKLSDTVLHNKFKLTPYLISYTLDDSKPVNIWKFDYLPSMTNDLDYLSDFYLSGTCGNYRCRDFVINVNFKKNINDKNTNFFELKAGPHSIKIEAWDFAGNYTHKEFNYNVR